MANKKNQIVIDLGKLKLNRTQREEIHKTLHKALVKETKANLNKNDLLNSKITSKTVTLKVDFTDVQVGLSTLTASCDGQQEQTITKSGSIAFSNAKKGSSISFDGSSNGTTFLSLLNVQEVEPADTLTYDVGAVQGGFTIIKL